MMQDVKYAIAWLWGLIYIGSIWVMSVVPAKQDGPMILLYIGAWCVFIASDVGLICLVFSQLIDHWNEGK